MAIKLEDFIPSGTNIFGARTPTYLEGLITPDQLKKAQQQSLFQGLLGTAVGYLAQPKNQMYGSAVPYLAKGYLQGMESAQAPFSNLEKDVLMKEKFADISRKRKQQKALDDALAEGSLYDPLTNELNMETVNKLLQGGAITEAGQLVNIAKEKESMKPKPLKPKERFEFYKNKIYDLSDINSETGAPKVVGTLPSEMSDNYEIKTEGNKVFALPKTTGVGGVKELNQKTGEWFSSSYKSYEKQSPFFVKEDIAGPINSYLQKTFNLSAEDAASTTLAITPQVNELMKSTNLNQTEAINQIMSERAKGGLYKKDTGYFEKQTDPEKQQKIGLTLTTGDGAQYTILGFDKNLVSETNPEGIILGDIKTKQRVN